MPNRLAFRIASRSLRRSPLFVIATCTAVAIAATTSLVAAMLVHDVFLAPLPLRDPARLVRLMSGSSRACTDCADVFDRLTFESLRQAHPGAFAQLTGRSGRDFVLDARKARRHISGAVVDSDYFDVIGAVPLAGRVFGSRGTLLDGYAPAVVSERIWSTYLNREPLTAGLTFTLSDRWYTVVGVLPNSMGLVDAADVWVPASAAPPRAASDRELVTGIARLRDGVSLERARAELAAIALPPLPGGVESQPTGAVLFPLEESARRSGGPFLTIVLAAAALTVVAAYLNLFSLFLARAATKAGDLAMAAALGASRRALVWQSLAEVFIIAIAGAIAAMVITVWGYQAAAALLTNRLGRATLMALHPGVLALASGVAIVTVLTLGWLALLHLPPRALHGSLRQGTGTVGVSKRSRRTRNALIVLQCAAAVVLLNSTVALLKSYRHLTRVDVGYDSSRILAAAVDVKETLYTTPEQSVLAGDLLVERLQHIPGVARAAVWSRTLSGLSGYGDYDRFTIEGRAAPLPRSARPLSATDVTPSFFPLFELPMIRGRNFTDDDRSGSGTPVVIVNAVAARLWWPGEDPIGKRLRLGGKSAPSEWLTVVGVVKDAQPMDESGVFFGRNHEDLFYPMLFRPRAQSMVPEGKGCSWFRCGGLTIGIRALGEMPSANTVRAAIADVAPGMIVNDVRTLRDLQLAGPMLYDSKLNAQLLGTFAIVITIVVAIGIYGMVADSVARRTREIGLRMALGAGNARILRTVMADGAAAAAIGVAGGACSCVALSGIVSHLFLGATPGNPRGFLFGQVRPVTPTTLAILCTGILVVGLAAGYVSARRALALQPGDALRVDL